jgi:hypothetical protein
VDPKIRRHIESNHWQESPGMRTSTVEKSKFVRAL